MFNLEIEKNKLSNHVHGIMAPALSVLEENNAISNSPITYQDIRNFCKDNHLKIKQLADYVSLENISDWNLKGIPPEYQSRLRELFANPLLIYAFLVKGRPDTNTVTVEALDAELNTPEEAKGETHELLHTESIQESKSNAHPPFKLTSIGELMRRTIKHDWLIKGLFECNTLGQIFGQSGSCKTFTVIDMSYCIAAGLNYCDRPTKQGKVVYVCGEGLVALNRRFSALNKKYGVDISDKLFISEQPAAFMDTKNTQLVAESVAAIGGVELIVIDTYHRNMGGGKEDSADDFAVVLSNIDTYLKPLNLTVIIIHHSGHSDQGRSRGSSAIRAAMDFEYMTKTDGKGGVILQNTKMKDGSTPPPMAFILTEIELGDDGEGNSVTSAYLDYLGEAKAIANKKLNLNDRDKNILTSLDESITTNGIEPTTDIKLNFGRFNSLDNKLQKVVDVKHWRDLAYKAITIVPKDSDANLDQNKQATKLQAAKLKAFTRSMDSLCKKGLVETYGGYAWRIF